MSRKYKKISLHYLHYLHYGGESAESAESAMQKFDMSYAVTQLAHLTQCANYAKCVMQFFYEDQKRTRLERDGTKK